MTYIHQILVSKELGGAGLIGIHLARFLRENRQKYCLWVPGEGAALRKIKQLELMFNKYDDSCVFSSSKIRASICNLKVFCSLFPYGNGILHTYSSYHYKALQMGLNMLRLKTVVHIQLQEEEEGLRWAFEKPPDVIVTCARTLTEYVRHTLPERYQEHQQIISVPNAVDIERFYPRDKVLAKQCVKAPDNIPLVLMVANLAPHKGQETAIRAMAILKSVGVDVACWFAGIERQNGGDYTTRLQALCAELGVADRVRFLGHREDVPDLLRAADIFVLPSTNEGLPLSVLEAQATKVPVLAAPTAGIPEVIIDGETGFLIPAEDATGYANRIESLLNQPEIYNYIRDQAYIKVTKEYNWQAYCKNIYSIYQSLV